MLTIIIGILIGVVTFYTTRGAIGSTWATVAGVVVLMAFQILMGLYIKRKVNAVTLEIQDIMMQAQAKINRKINHMQQRQSGNPKSAQQMLEKEQNDAIRECLTVTSKVEKYFLWNALLKKQIISMRMMLYFQLREYKKVDELMPKALILDARSVAIKAVRMFKNQDPKVIKYLEKKCRRFKNDDAVLLYSLLAWILVKEEKISEAAALLADAKNKVDNQLIIDNYDRLANGKIKHFSNASLGDAWYALYLEEPKIKQQRVVQRGY